MCVKEQWKRPPCGSEAPGGWEPRSTKFLVDKVDVSFICLYFLVFRDLFPLLTVCAELWFRSFWYQGKRPKLSLRRVSSQVYLPVAGEILNQSGRGCPMIWPKGFSFFPFAFYHMGSLVRYPI